MYMINNIYYYYITYYIYPHIFTRRAPRPVASSNHLQSHRVSSLARTRQPHQRPILGCCASVLLPS